MNLTIGISIDHSALDRLEARLPGRVNSLLQDTVKMTIDIVKREWSSTSPSSPGTPPAKVTGRLDSSINGQVKNMVGRVWASAEHGAYNEFGTVKAPARPFLFPAAMLAASWLDENAIRVFRVG